MQAECSIFFHNYYGMHEKWLTFFNKNIPVSFNLYYNIVLESIYNQEFATSKYFNIAKLPDKEKQYLNNIYFRQSANKGKDIGGKMVLLDTYLKLNSSSDYGLFLHDKKSLYKTNNITWANNLLKIAEITYSKKAIEILRKFPEVGIVTFKENIKNEYNYDNQNFISNNNMLLPGLQKKFGIYPISFNYIAGTMFWFRMKPLVDFFNKHEPLRCRELLENGNVTDDKSGTYTHCWERLLCWIITAQGYKINTI